MIQINELHNKYTCLYLGLVERILTAVKPRNINNLFVEPLKATISIQHLLYNWA